MKKNMKKQVLGFHVYNCKFSEVVYLTKLQKKPDEELIFWKDFLIIIFFGWRHATSLENSPK